MKIIFDLTDEQSKTMEPLAQIMHSEVSAKFIKAETTSKIITILKEDGYGD